MSCRACQRGQSSNKEQLIKGCMEMEIDFMDSSWQSRLFKFVSYGVKL